MFLYIGQVVTNSVSLRQPNAVRKKQASVIWWATDNRNWTQCIWNYCLHLFLDIPVQQKKKPLHCSLSCTDFLSPSLQHLLFQSLKPNVRDLTAGSLSRELLFYRVSTYQNIFFTFCIHKPDFKNKQSHHTETSKLIYFYWNKFHVFQQRKRGKRYKINSVNTLQKKKKKKSAEAKLTSLPRWLQI